jgi:dihydropteroate synthase
MTPLDFPLRWGERTFVMGVLNITPDSFSGDGLLGQADLLDAAVSQARQFVRDGAHIIDIGGESTRPGAQPVSLQEEIDRVVPVINVLAAAGLDAFISVDTSKAAVASAALQAGAHWINDERGLRGDPEMAGVAAQFHAPIILMHNRLRPAQAEVQPHLGGRYTGVHYRDLLGEVKGELMDSVALAYQANIPADQIILDPGIGFGKTVAQSLELINRLDELRSLGYPLLVGPSRKSFIGFTLDLPPDQRMEGTAAAVAVSIVRGADIIRVHDVAVMARVARMTDAIVRPRPSASTQHAPPKAGAAGNFSARAE